MTLTENEVLLTPDQQRFPPRRSKRNDPCRERNCVVSRAASYWQEVNLSHEESSSMNSAMIEMRDNDFYRFVAAFDKQTNLRPSQQHRQTRRSKNNYEERLRKMSLQRPGGVALNDYYKHYPLKQSFEGHDSKVRVPPASKDLQRKSRSCSTHDDSPLSKPSWQRMMKPSYADLVAGTPSTREFQHMWHPDQIQTGFDLATFIELMSVRNLI